MWEKVRQSIRKFANENLGLRVEKTNLEEKKDSSGVDLVKITLVITGTKDELERAADEISDSILDYTDEEAVFDSMEEE